MGAYILRRLLLVIPTLLGVMIINFALTQYMPGGPVDQALARLEGSGDSLEGIAGSGDDVGGEEDNSGYIGARGLPPDFIAELEVQYGFARITCAEGFTGTPSRPRNARKN
jgi:microcin C transport system permease protein